MRKPSQEHRVGNLTKYWRPEISLAAYQSDHRRIIPAIKIKSRFEIEKVGFELSFAASFWRLDTALNSLETLPRCHVRWIELQCDLKLLERLIQPA